MNKIYKVTLTPDEWRELIAVVSTGKSNAATIKYANILLAVDDVDNAPLSDHKAAKRFHCHAKTVYNIRERFVEHGFEAALERKKRETPPTPPIFDGRVEARLIAIACSTPPEGSNGWTLQLFADKCVELNIVETTSHETVRTVLKKMNFNLTSNNAV